MRKERDSKVNKILISSCVFGNQVRWNGTDRADDEIKKWALENNFLLVPVCPEHELFGTPRQPIRLMQREEDVLAIIGKQEVYEELINKSREIAQEHRDAVGFIGISNSPSCGLSVGVKGRGGTIKAPMHQSMNCPTTEISSMRSEANRDLFLRRVKKFIEGNKK